MIEQTLFALPFAYIGVLFAGGGSPWQWAWVTIALFAARTAGMSFNRALDAGIDSKNPRTSQRLIPRGEVTPLSAWILSFFFSGLLVLAAYMLNTLCFYLSFPAVAMLMTYSLFKRFSAGSHFYLGLIEAAAPIGGYLAIRPSFEYPAFLPGLAIMFWIAGLDIIYALQDMAFDRESGLFSIPARYGKKTALALSWGAYLISTAALAGAGLVSGMGVIYFCAIAGISGIMIAQQIIVFAGLNNIGETMIRVFFLNRFISPILFIGALADDLFRAL